MLLLLAAASTQRRYETRSLKKIASLGQIRGCSLLLLVVRSHQELGPDWTAGAEEVGGAPNYLGWLHIRIEVGTVHGRDYLVRRTVTST